MIFNRQIRNRLLSDLILDNSDDTRRLNDSLRLLSKWRSLLIQHTIIQKNDTVVWQGSFAILEYLERFAEGCHAAKLLGCYEQPLHQHIENIIETNYETVVNIGSAEGYYKVGLALRMPRSKILAFDTNEVAQAACAGLARANGVEDRIFIGGNVDHSDFQKFSKLETVIICDIEGAERALLDPLKAAHLLQFDIIVQGHECPDPDITSTLITRFKKTHTITIVEDHGQRTMTDAPSWFKSLSHLDQLLSVWEWRSDPTPWIIMKANQSRCL